jgi:pSer/pThr/pTyr-binding forkhead associated (FHA) protein
MKGRLLIGRDPNLCDVVLDDRDVSRQHARIRQEGKEFFIYDDASMNGTFVNGQRIDRAPLHDGDRIEVGNTELEFRVEGKE